MHPYDNHLPRRVCFGRGSVGKIPELAKSLVAASAPFTLGMNPSIHPTSGSQPRVFVVTDPGVRQAGLVEPLLEQLKDRGLLCGCYDRVSLEPPLEMVDELAVELRDSDAQVIVGLGGGSVMDATKVAGVVARVANGLRSSDSSAQRLGSARDYVGIGKVPARGLPTILVPTTAGTGSEATFVAILTDKATGNKVGVVSPYLLPDIAVVDPELTDRLPPTITAATGMDAIVHALEATIAKVATPLAQGLAWRAARELGGAIERVVEHPDDQIGRAHV